MSTCIIIAGGPSFIPKQRKRFPRESTHLTVGVNDAAYYMRTTYAVTMDRVWLENRYELVNLTSNIWYRECIAKNLKPGPRHIAFKNNNRPGAMSDDPLTLNGQDSATCALNFAYHFDEVKTIYLIGYDMQRGPNDEAHWWDDYPWNRLGPKPARMADEWAPGFGAAAEQFKAKGVEVFNVNSRSLITAFPIISYDEFLVRAA